MEVLVYDEEDRRYVPLVAALVLALIVAVVSAGLALLLGTRADAAPGRAAAPAAAQTTAPSPAVSPPPVPTGDAEADQACTVLAERADVALERSRRLVAALEAHTRVMDELLAGRLTAQQALDRDLPTMTQSASDRAQFADELAAYERARSACRG